LAVKLVIGQQEVNTMHRIIINTNPKRGDESDSGHEAENGGGAHVKLHAF
jgi:hypothetical protein